VNQTTTEGLLGLCGQIATQGVPEVYLMLSTPGGSVDHGITIYNTLRAMPFKLTTHNVGNVDSIGNAIFLAGEERFCNQNASFLFHGVAWNTPAASAFEERHLRDILVNVTRQQGRIGAIMASRTQIKTHELKKLFRRAETRDAQYAKANGIVHDIREAKVPAGAPVHSFVFQR
jgi:ATP-dependent protease ClpP protease subunit